MPTFGAKTISDLVKEMENASMSALEVAGNSSIKMKSTEALTALAPGLKAHKAIKTLDLTDCEITDGGCDVLADIFANNHVIETVILEKNKISSTGAGKLADGLAQNQGIRTLNLLQQAVKSFGDECLDHFVVMYGTNITLTKMTWRLDSRKSFMLAKLQTRNIEIQKAKAAGKDFQHLLPDNLKSGAAPAAPAAAPAPPAPAAAEEVKPPSVVARKSTVEDIEKHVAAIAKELPEEPQGASSVQSAWDNHFAAFGGQDVEKILQDYSEQSTVTVYDQTTGANTVYRGLAGVRECFVGLFKSLFDCSDLSAPVQVVNEASAGEPGSVFLIWYCPASGYRQATDTFIFDKSNKILWQNVVVSYQDPKGDGSVVAKNDSVAPTGSGAVHDGWANHFAAFGGQDVEKILQDYIEESEITVFNHADGSNTVFKGLDGAKNCFEGLFKSLFDCSNLGAPIIHVEESVSGAAGQVFLVWCAPASGYARATDTFIFNSAGKITRQHVVVHYYAPASSVQAAWDNHFAAFGGQNVEKILQDYSEQSIITVHDQTTGANTVYRGVAGASECFVGLFKSLYDCSDLSAPVQLVKENSAGEPGSVFLIWYCPASGYRQATDTFIFDKSNKILWQNVVVVYQDPKGDGSVVAKNDSVAPTGSGPVHDGWANHFAAFGGQDVEKILQDYIEESEITVFNHNDGAPTHFKGIDGAKTCFEGLFKNLHDCSNLAAPIIHVEESVDGAAGQVFLVWCCPASGYARATDTFIFNSEGKITRQHVVVHYEAAS